MKNSVFIATVTLMSLANNLPADVNDTPNTTIVERAHTYHMQKSLEDPTKSCLYDENGNLSRKGGGFCTIMRFDDHHRYVVDFSAYDLNGNRYQPKEAYSYVIGEGSNGKVTSISLFDKNGELSETGDRPFNRTTFTYSSEGDLLYIDQYLTNKKILEFSNYGPLFYRTWFSFQIQPDGRHTRELGDRDPSFIDQFGNEITGLVSQPALNMYMPTY